MPLIKSKDVMARLSISRESLRQLVKRGKLTGHKLALTGGSHAVRYDTEEIDRLEAEFKRSSKSPAKTGKKVTRAARSPRPPARKALRGLISFD